MKRSVEMPDVLTSNFVEDSRQSQRQDAETITDICYRDSGSEIHMISLLEERIPRYCLRSDALTNFAGYENEDYTIRTPCFQEEFDPNLSADLIEETLKYFIMGGARISQITKTFDDSRALTLLLEEKERDLEIAAELGKILVDRVRQLEKTVARRTQENEKLTAQISNLQRELTLRDSLLRVHVDDFDSDAEPEDGEKCITECTSLRLTAVHVENLRKKVKTLQTENDRMASDVQRIAVEMGDGQEREDSLVTTCIDDLLQMNYSILFLREELDAKVELVARQQEELNSYSEQILAVEAKAKKVSGELRRTSKKLSEAETQQQTAIAEIEAWKERYTECWNLLQAANDELRSLRREKSKTTSVIHRTYSSSSVSLSPFLPLGSLASELHDSQKKDLFCHLGYSPSATRQHSRRVMDVAKAVARISARRCLVSSEDQVYTGGPDDGGAGGEEDDGISNGDSLESQCGSLGHTGSDDDISDSELNDTDRSDWSQKQKVISDFYHLSLGQPGIPGSNDLEVALMRLNSPTMFSSPNVAPINCLSLPDDTQSKESLSPLPPHLSTEARSRTSSVTNLSEANSFTFAKPKIPEKLQIVKPLEGSLTLNHWKSLGVPHLQGLLEHRPGVQTKDQPPVQLFQDESELFSLSDYEEDAAPTNKAADRIIISDGNSRFLDKPSSIRADNYNVTNAKNAEKSGAGNVDGRLRYIDDCQTMTLPDIVTSEKRTSHSKETTTTSKRIQSCAFM